MKKTLTKQDAEDLGAWFDEHIDETEAEWETARRNGGISTVGELGCASLAEAASKASAIAVPIAAKR